MDGHHNFNPHATLKVAVRRDALAALEDGDLLACRNGHTLDAEAIKLAGRGPWTHIATFFTVRHGQASIPYVVEMVEKFGGRCVPWDWWIAQRTDAVDVFRPRDPSYDLAGAVAWLLQNIPGRTYSNATIRRFLFQNAFFIRWFFRPSCDDAAETREYVCSTARAAADRLGGGVDPVRQLADAEVQPSDLARSGLYQYQFTLKGARP